MQTQSKAKRRPLSIQMGQKGGLGLWRGLLGGLSPAGTVPQVQGGLGGARGLSRGSRCLPWTAAALIRTRLPCLPGNLSGYPGDPRDGSLMTY